MYFPTKKVFVVFVLSCMGAGIANQSARAQTFNVLHSFHSGKGPQAPQGRLIRDKVGNVYGITAIGGSGICYKRVACGTAFKMDKTGKLLWVHSFGGANGANPYAGLLRDTAGNFYGTTANGGKNTKGCGNDQVGCGVVFKLDPTGQKESVLYFFTGTGDGWSPESLLVEDTSGNLYGTTIWDGYQNNGVIFKVSQTGKETVLYTFQGGEADGGVDVPGVVWGPNGNLYGVGADWGAYGHGVVFELDSTGKETVLYSFSGTDGADPTSILADSAGNLFGTTEYGGNLSDYCDGNEGCGVVFKLSPNSSGVWTETTLYVFCSQASCADGHRPTGGLLRDAAGNLYGTTIDGGQKGSNCNGGDCGVVFKLDTAGKETVLHTFTGGRDGQWPDGGLIIDTAGSLYGTALQGGDLKCAFSYIKGCGVVFKITP
jgi:uncharacterized repeat protein (TIGR03803 family)